MRRLKLVVLACLSTLVSASAAHAASPGVNVIGDLSQATTQRALDTGAREIRFFVGWDGAEPQAAGDFDGRTPNNLFTRELFDRIDQVHQAGRRVRLVITNAPSWANGGKSAVYPPTPDHRADFAAFAARVVGYAKSRGSSIAGLEVWNEPDGGEFWLPGPDPAAYTALLKPTYAAVKAADPSVEVDLGPTAGNDYPWLASLYADGAKGSFDAVDMHTDTACLTAAPSTYYRDTAQGNRIGQFSFLGYREMRAVMLANGDDKPMNMSELGWSASQATCAKGAGAGTKPEGVGTALQGTYLTQAFECMANDPYVKTADWFDLDDSAPSNLYGLYLTGGVLGKSDLDAFTTVAGTDGGAAAHCGDFEPPVLTVTAPVSAAKFVTSLTVSATATDSESGLQRISFQVDKDPSLALNFGPTSTNVAFGDGKPISYTFTGTKKLADGPHTVTVTATDALGNSTSQTLPVVKVDQSDSGGGSTVTRFKLPGKPSCHKRVCTLKGRLLDSSGTAVTAGKVAIAWSFRNKKGKYVVLHKALKPAKSSFAFRQKLTKGRWKAKVSFAAAFPYKASSRTYAFTIR